MRDMSNILECKSLYKRFDRKEAVVNVNLTLESGKIIGLLGPNGSGKTTLIKLINGLLVPSSGEILVNGLKPGVESKKIVSYLPERNCLNNWMKVSELIQFFSDFYMDFDKAKAADMLERLHISQRDKLKTMSKGTKEKVQLILAMSRKAKLYCLDEPIGGVDPASRDYIINTIISNYSEDAAVLISTHLINEVEMILDDAIFIQMGNVVLHDSVENIRVEKGQSLDGYFRGVFKC